MERPNRLIPTTVMVHPPGFLERSGASLGDWIGIAIHPQSDLKVLGFITVYSTAAYNSPKGLGGCTCLYAGLIS